MVGGEIVIAGLRQTYIIIIIIMIVLVRRVVEEFSTTDVHHHHHHHDRTSEARSGGIQCDSREGQFQATVELI